MPHGCVRHTHPICRSVVHVIVLAMLRRALEGIIPDLRPIQYRSDELMGLGDKDTGTAVMRPTLTMLKVVKIPNRRAREGTTHSRQVGW